jgi:hypothetical protein
MNGTANNPFVDPTDPTITADNAIDADLRDSPVTVSFWVRLKGGATWDTVGHSFFAFGRWMFQPHHNAANNQGFSAGTTNFGWASWNPGIRVTYKDISFTKCILAGYVYGYRSSIWINTFTDWFHVLAYFTPGQAKNDRAYNGMYFNGDNTEGTIGSMNTPNGTDIFPNAAANTSDILANAFTDPYYYLSNRGTRTIVGGSSDSNGNTGADYEMKQLVIYNSVIPESDITTIYNSGTPLANKDLYPGSPMTGYMFPNSMTYEPDFFNSQQGEKGRWRMSNVFGDKYDLTSNYYRETSDNSLYAKQGNYPSPIINQNMTGISN